MALIRTFFHEPNNSSRVHSEVDCRVQLVTSADGDRFIQLDTYGSDERKSEKKVSQSIQLDRTHARELVAIIEAVFPSS